MSLLSFLKTATAEKVTTTHRGGGVKKPWNPPADVLAVRVWRDGSVFPSQALVDRFQLEYHKVNITKGAEIPYTEEQKNEHLIAMQALPEDKRTELKPKFKPSLIESKDGVFGNGFDVIDSRLWGAYKAAGHMLFVCPVPKDLPKVDLFGATKFDGEGNPVQGVMDQGSKTYGEDTLLASIKDLYGIELNDNRQYVDMLVVEELPVGDEVVNFNKQFASPVFLTPKVVNRGKDKGKPDYERRENTKIYGFLPSDIVGETVTDTIEDVPVKADGNATSEVKEEALADA